MINENRNNTTFRLYVSKFIQKARDVNKLMTNAVTTIDYYSFLEGCVSGMFGVTISHWLDTIKSNLQTGTKIQYNPRFLSKGIASPLLGTGFEKALVFGIFNNTHDYLKHNYSFGPMTNIAISGGFSGFCASFIVAPFDKAKIMCQTNDKVKIRPRNLFKGLGLFATFTREIPGFTIYFPTYELVKKNISNNNSNSNSVMSSFIAGGVSGALSWCCICPQDKIKTRIQHGSCNKSYYQVGKSIYAEGGIKAFYKDFHFVLMPAILRHAGIFAMMEVLKKY